MDFVERVEQAHWLAPPPNMIRNIPIGKNAQDNRTVIAYRKLTQFGFQLSRIIRPPLAVNMKHQFETPSARTEFELWKKTIDRSWVSIIRFPTENTPDNSIKCYGRTVLIIGASTSTSKFQFVCCPSDILTIMYMQGCTDGCEVVQLMGRFFTISRFYALLHPQVFPKSFEVDEYLHTVRLEHCDFVGLIDPQGDNGKADSEQE